MSRFCDNVNSFNVSNNYTIADERPEILSWLSPLEPRIRHQDIRIHRVDGLGDWLLRTNEFQRWSDGQDKSGKAALFCHGNPGVGKTYISSLVIDSLFAQASQENVAVACFYYDFAVQKEQTTTSVLGALLKQVVGTLQEIPEDIHTKFKKQKEFIGGLGLRQPELVKMLETLLPSLQRTYLCIDALDECLPEHRLELLDSLRCVLRNSPGTRIFFTGRAHVRREVERHLGGAVVVMSISPCIGDIINYIRMKIAKDTIPDAMDGDLEEDIINIITENVSETFLLVALNVEVILGETTKFRRRQKLNAMASGLGLGDAYAATLERIKAQGGDKSRLGMAAMMWVSHSKRPLTPDELCHALSVEVGSMHLNPHNIPSIGTLVNCCLGLVTVDTEASTVRLVHFTLQEYLRTRSDLFAGAHATIAEICLTYLNFECVHAISPKEDAPHQKFPFLLYASLHWGIHARKETSSGVASLAFKLFNQYETHVSAKLLIEAAFSGDRRVGMYTSHKGFTGLHCAAIFGILEIAIALINSTKDLNERDFSGRTALFWAADYGHEEMVRLLLQRADVNPNSANKDGETPLMRAVFVENEGIVKLLLGRDDINPNCRSKNGETPLVRAVFVENEGIVKLLLGRDDINPNCRGKDGETPLEWAAVLANEEITKLLLAWDDVNPNCTGEGGRTPLLWAAYLGHEGIVKLLLGRGDTDHNLTDDRGLTPRLWADRKGHEGVVKILMDYETSAHRTSPTTAPPFLPDPLYILPVSTQFDPYYKGSQSQTSSNVADSGTTGWTETKK